jgi:hypothetical protein
MEWTKEKPTVLYGYYFVWHKGCDIADVVLVSAGRYFQVDFSGEHNVEDWDVWWYGPIQPPTLPNEPD